MSKLTLAAIVCATAVSAFANKEAIVLYRTTFENDSTGSAAEANSACRARLSAEVATAETRLAKGEYDEIIGGDVQYACRKVVLSAVTKSDNYTVDFWGNSIFDRGHRRQTSFVVTCEPRKFEEKYHIKLARVCETTTNDPECARTSFLKKLSRIKNTEFVYSFSRNCSP